MKKILFLSLLSLLLTVGTQAQQIANRKYVSIKFNNVSLSEALKLIDEASSRYSIHFIYNDLEDFRVTTSVERLPVPDAVRRVAGFYPVRISQSDSLIVVECTHKTDRHLRGTIVDEQGQPVAYANIAILNPADSALLSGGVSNESGYFAIPYEQEPVLARISFIGYKTVYRLCSQEDMGTIRMHSDNVWLKTVKVTGQAILNTSSGYKVSVGALHYAKDRMLTDLLPFLPGVSIDNDKILILGNPVTSYYIDGIRTTDPNALKSLPTDRIETIEVDYQAGADESKSAVGGIIRITTRKAPGYSGDIKAVLQLQPANGLQEETLSNTLSASIGKLYLLNSLSLTHNTPKIHEAETYTTKGEETSCYATDRSGKWRRTYLNEYLGLNYSFSESRQLKGSLWYALADMLMTDRVTTSQDNGMHVSARKAPTCRHTLQGVADYVWKPKAGQQLDVIVDYLYRHQRDRSILSPLPLGGVGGRPGSEDRQAQNTHMLRLQPKWQQGLSASLMLTAGLDYQYTNYRNDLNEQTTMKSSAPAAFAILQGKTTDRSAGFPARYEVGLRIQHTNMQVDAGTEKNGHNDFGIYPTVNLMWMLNPKRQHTLSMMYKYSMEDLPYSVVSTYHSYTSPVSYETGNPQLKSPTAHQLLLVGRLWGKLTLTTAFLRSVDEICFVSHPSPSSPMATQVKPYNCAFAQGIMVGAEYLLSVADVWTSKPRVQIRKMSGQMLGSRYNNPASLTFDCYNDIRFTPTFSCQLTFHYEPTAHYLDHTLQRVYHLNLSLTKSLCRDRLLLGLRALPIVRNRKSSTDNPSLAATYHNLTREQYVALSATWRFPASKHHEGQSTAGSLQHYKQFEKEK